MIGSHLSAPELRVRGQARVVLQGVEVEARLQDLVSEVEICQTYRTLEQRNIEAVYTFALPLDAVLLELVVHLGERKLRGHVVEKTEAEERYENAITDGDSVVMLERAADGVYTMNVGNLMAGETARVRFRYALLQQWQDDTLRFLLPTVIAPRYGSAARAGLAPHQEPDTDTTGDVENRFRLRVKVTGLLRQAEFDCPTHRVTTERGEESTVISLADGSAVMDRDFVLNFRLDQAGSASATVSRDRDGYVALASFNPRFPVRMDDAPRSLKVVIDCSGSMMGDSIGQARRAFMRILDSLRPQDCFNIVVFGSTARALFPTGREATGPNLIRARKFARQMDADMGGTEIAPALNLAYRLTMPAGKPRGDVLLITDGEFWNDAVVTEDARASGHRVFTVGVGSAVAEAGLRELADATGGACELVAPTEEMAGHVYRHFQRIYLPRAERVSLSWPAEPEEVESRRLNAVFSGDTVHVFARFRERPEGTVTLRAELTGGRRVELATDIRALESGEADAGLSTLARLGAAAKLRGLTARLIDNGEPEEHEDVRARAVELATAYQLVSEVSNYLVLHVRADDEKAVDLPDLRKVRQTVAAGWHGLGSVAMGAPVAYSTRRKAKLMSVEYGMVLHDAQPMFLRRNLGIENRFMFALNQCIPSASERLPVTSLRDLETMGLSGEWLSALRALVEVDGEDEYMVVVALLKALVDMDSEKELSLRLKRMIRKAYKEAGVPRKLRHAVGRIVTP